MFTRTIDEQSSIMRSRSISCLRDGMSTGGVLSDSRNILVLGRQEYGRDQSNMALS